MESPKPERKLTTEEEQDAQIGLLEWELEDRESRHGIDALTGVHKREVFEHELDQSLKLVEQSLKLTRGDIENKRGGVELLKEVSLIFIDIDHFKQVNDIFGHPAGDEVLRSVADMIKHSIRETDLVARVGGEELVVLLRGADVSVAARQAEELRAKIEQLSFEAYPKLKVAASFGVVSSQTSTDAKTLYGQADKALYSAKRGGRNRVVVYEPQ